jgi:sporulation protein YlmC with PRC-barrel domain
MRNLYAIMLVAVLAGPLPALAQNAPAATPGATSNTQQASSEYLASNLIDTDVYTAANENIGEIKDVVIGPDGKVASVVVSVGGFLGVGDRHVAMPYTSLKMVREGNNDEPKITVDASKDTLNKMPEYKYRTAGSATNSNTGSSTGTGGGAQ